MPAVDALTVRTQVHEQLRGQTFRTIIDSFVGDLDGRGFLDISGRSKLALGSDRFTRAMQMAETFYLSPEMQELVQAASTAPDFPDDEVILREDPPSDAGFLFLPARFRIMEMRGRIMIAHAVVWLNNTIWWLCDRRDPEDQINQELNASRGQTGLPRYDLMSVQQFDFNKALPTNLGFPAGVLPTDAYVKFSKDANGNAFISTDYGMSPQGMTPTENRSPELKFLLTIWRLMQQTLARVTTEDEHPKWARRDALKAKVPDTRVHVIQLRRRESHATGTGAPLTHRFPVRGHWARRWCGPQENRVLRAVFIHPYIRGPEGTPIIVRDRVNALIR